MEPKIELEPDHDTRYPPVDPAGAVCVESGSTNPAAAARLAKYAAENSRLQDVNRSLAAKNDALAAQVRTLRENADRISAERMEQTQSFLRQGAEVVRLREEIRRLQGELRRFREDSWETCGSLSRVCTRLVQEGQWRVDAETRALDAEEALDKASGPSTRGTIYHPPPMTPAAGDARD